MSIFIDPTRTVEYVLKDQRPHWKCCGALAEEEHKTTCTERSAETLVTPEDQIVKFTLRVMSARQWAAMVGEEVTIGKREAREVTTTDVNNCLIRHGVVGWSPEQTKPEIEKSGLLSWTSVDQIPVFYRTELADAIWRLNTVFERDLGNSQ